MLLRLHLSGNLTDMDASFWAGVLTSWLYGKDAEDWLVRKVSILGNSVALTKFPPRNINFIYMTLMTEN